MYASILENMEECPAIMKILIIGGTVFVGRHIVEAALAAGHEVTLFNRGLSGPDLFAGVEKIKGDRREGFELLGDRHWDAVVDTCGAFPAEVELSCAQLRRRADRYVYLSSFCVYRDWGLRDQDESSPLRPPLPKDAPPSEANYFERKADCERAAAKAWASKALIIRPGVISGPFDPGDTLAYWLLRAGRGGEVLAPGNPRRNVQILDVRDLARWLVAMIEARSAGTFNVCGDGVTMEGLLNECREVGGGRANYVWVDEAFLVKRLEGLRGKKITPLRFLELLPFWIPGQNDRFSTAAAKAAGFTARRLSETIADTQAWLSAQTRTPDDFAKESFLRSDAAAALLAQWRAVL
jgi:2'-hydroxyisoflavone reductase